MKRFCLAALVLACLSAHALQLPGPQGAPPPDASTLTGTTLAASIVNSSLTAFGNSPTLVTPIFTGLPTGTGVASANTASTVVARDVSGNFAAGTITAALTGNVTGNCSGSSGSTTGNALTATTLQTARAINGTNFDGSAPITITAAAGTLTGASLAAGVTGSSLTSVGTLASPTLTTPVIASGLTATGAGSITFVGSSATFLTSTGANTLSGATTINDATTPSLTTATGKTNTGFVLINGKTSGSTKYITADATAQAVTVNTAAQTVGAATLTIPDQAGTSRNYVFDTLTQGLTNKTINGNTFTAGTYTLTGTAAKTLNFTNTLTLSGTDSTTMTFPTTTATIARTDAANTFTGVQSFSGVIAHNGGVTATGAVANDFSGASGTFLTSTGANQLSGAVTISDATTPSLTTASGKTNTGFVLINGKTSGSTKFTTADATAQALTVNTAAQTVGAATLTIPDQAGISRNVVTNKSGRATAQVAANANVLTFTTPATDGSYIVSVNVLVTTSTTHSFNVFCTYTDEGNTAHNQILSFTDINGGVFQAIANTGGAHPCTGIPIAIRTKAASTIVFSTSGTFTIVTYNVEAHVQQCD